MNDIEDRLFNIGMGFLLLGGFWSPFFIVGLSVMVVWFAWD